MKSIDQLRRDAKALRRAYEALDPDARRRIEAHPPKDGRAPRHADFLNVIAREAGFPSWPRLAWAAETIGLDRAERRVRLRQALTLGQHWRVDHLLTEDPTLADGDLSLACALLDEAAVAEMVAADPACVTRELHGRRPILHLAFSQHHRQRPDRLTTSVAIAERLLDAGADPNDRVAHEDSGPLSVLYAALGHAGNLPLAAFLLKRGADPDDGESLYHATELGHPEGLRLLLAHGARAAGTNALLRAMDFNDHTMVRMLLEAGADPNEGWDGPGMVGLGQVTALHQAARRMNDGAMAELLLEFGADPAARYDSLTPYDLARVYGNAPVADAIGAAGGAHTLTPEVETLARIADGHPADRPIDPAGLPLELRHMVRSMLHQDGALDHVRRLIEAGLEYDAPDDMGLTPVQIAGWEGLPEVLSYFVGLGPDLSHVNAYGGTLLSTIVHGSEHCPHRATRDHVECARRALAQGVALPRRMPVIAGDADMAAFLQDWAERHPGQVVD